MRPLRRFLNRLLSWTTIQRDEERLRLEIEEHIALQTSENLQAGMSQAEAHRHAVLKFGAIESIKETYRDQKGLPVMQTLIADIRQASRTLRNNPAFTVVALAALTIGIGANTGIFSVVNKVLLQPLPYPEPDRLVQIGSLYGNKNYYYVSIPKFMFWRDNHVFSHMAIYNGDAGDFNLSIGGHPDVVGGARVSSDFFGVFGVSPILGRTFSPSEDQPNGPKVAIINEQLWRSRFASDPKILTRTMDLNSEPRQIVGVMPASFFPVPDAQVWIPMQADPASATRGDYLHLAARLKPGVSIAEAREEMAILGERFRKLNPKVMDDKESIAVTGLRDAMVEYTREALYILLAAVGLVLLLACANVASLLLARALSRQRELAIRAAIGASRARVIRQLLTESVLLSTIGGVLGSLLGVWGVRALLLLVPAHIPRIGSAVQLTDWRVLGFTISISMLTGIVFGLVPALQLSNPNLASTLKEAGTRSTTGRRQNFIRKTLVAVEMALAIILLIGAALLIRTFVGLRTAETGIDPNHVLTMTTSLSGRRYQTTEAQYLLTSQALKKIEAIPGVEAASCATTLPARGAIDLDFTIVGKPVSPGQNATGDVQWRGISPHHFNVFRGPVKRGRVFNDHDTPTSAPVVVVNSAFAEKFFKNENPIGKSLIVGTGPGLKEAPREIVGIVADVREAGIARGPEPVMYVPQSQQQQAMTQILNSPSWAIRSTIDQTSLIAAVTKAIQSVDGQLALANVKTMDSILHEGLARQSFNMLLLSIFAASALLLAAIGIYGLMSYSVEQQTQEIGVRMALGAGKWELFQLVLKQGMPPALIGVGVGLAAAFGLTRLLASLLYEVQPTDPLSFIGVAATLLFVALIAVLIPARRAMSVDPLSALRTE